MQTDLQAGESPFGEQVEAPPGIQQEMSTWGKHSSGKLRLKEPENSFGHASNYMYQINSPRKDFNNKACQNKADTEPGRLL
jgi:hypothetical protein